MNKSPWIIDFEIPPPDPNPPAAPEPDEDDTCICVEMPDSIHYVYHEVMDAILDCDEGISPPNIVCGAATALCHFALQHADTEEHALAGKAKFMSAVGKTYLRVVEQLKKQGKIE